MRILALDLATKTGWAHSSGPSGVQDFKPRRGDSKGMMWIEVKAWLRRFLDAEPTDVICYEQAHHRGGAATHSAHSLICCVEEVAAQREIEVTSRRAHDIKFHATGRRNASKGEMIAAAKARWPETEIIDDNHADALWLLSLTRKELHG